MNHLTEIVHSISLSIFEKVNTIPYAIRQFLKCLYESARVHFKAQELDLFRLIGEYLLKNWLLKVMFHKFNLEGFIPEFYISSVVKANLSLASHIMFNTMTFQEWELQTPDTDLKGLFTMNQQLKTDLQKESKVFFRGLLQLDSDFSSPDSLQ